MIFPFLSFDWDIETQYTLYVFVVLVKMSKTKSNGTWTRNHWLIHQCNQLLVSGVSNWKNKEQGQRLLFVLKHFFAISCFVRTETATYACSRLKSHQEVGLSRNSVWGIYSTHNSKISVQSAKLTVLKLFKIFRKRIYTLHWFTSGVFYTRIVLLKY